MRNNHYPFWDLLKGLYHRRWCNGAGKKKDYLYVVWIHSEAYGSAWGLSNLGFVSIDTYRPCTKGYQKTTKLSIGLAWLSTPINFTPFALDPEDPESDRIQCVGDAGLLRSRCGVKAMRRRRAEDPGWLWNNVQAHGYKEMRWVRRHVDSSNLILLIVLLKLK